MGRCLCLRNHKLCSSRSGFYTVHLPGPFRSLISSQQPLLGMPKGNSFLGILSAMSTGPLKDPFLLGFFEAELALKDNCGLLSEVLRGQQTAELL